jgi:putative peptidoglycan lipid II flippase
VGVKVLASGFYARQDTRTPVKIAVISMITNIVLNLILIVPLRHAGLALSTSLAALLNSGLLYYHLRKQAVFELQPGWGLLLLRIGIASTVMASLLLWGSGTVTEWFVMGRLERAIHLMGWIVSGITIYFMSLFILGLRLHHLSLKQS